MRLFPLRRRTAAKTTSAALAAALAAAALGVPGCADLNEEVVTGVTAPYLNTAPGYEDLVRATYRFAREFYGRERGFSLTEYGVDTFTKGSDGDFKYLNDYTSQFDASDNNVRDVWRFMYEGINAANAVVGRAGQVAMDERVKTRRVAEARFLRAFYYFHLVQLFGDVHLTLEETTDPTSQATRAPRAEVYRTILEDLAFAETNLPEATADYGRATKGAARHLLAKVHLTRGEAGDFARAADYAQAVISGGQYALLPRWADVFDQRNERHREVVWAVQYTADPLTNGGGAQVGGGTTNYANGNQGHLYFLMEYDVLPGMQRTIEYGRPFKRFRPTDYLLNLYDQQHDSRYRDGFQVMWRANNAGTIPRDASGRPRFAVGDTAVFLPGRQMTAAEIASKPYRIYTPSQYSTRIFPSTVKFLDPLRPSVSEEGGSRDYQVFRLAETYLIAAEGLLRSGRAADALPFINAVRRRAALPGSEAQMQLSAGQLTLDVILDERARELAAESMRWFDLVRTGTLLERVKAHNPDARDNIREHHVLRPIPQTQIDRTAGGRQTFPQNPGY
jgi:hypothetical protein